MYMPSVLFSDMSGIKYVILILSYLQRYITDILLHCNFTYQCILGKQHLQILLAALLQQKVCEDW